MSKLPTLVLPTSSRVRIEIELGDGRYAGRTIYGAAIHEKPVDLMPAILFELESARVALELPE